MKGSILDQTESEMMNVRWRFFTFRHQFDVHCQKTVPSCTHCFATMLLLYGYIELNCRYLSFAVTMRRMRVSFTAFDKKHHSQQVPPPNNPTTREAFSKQIPPKGLNNGKVCAICVLSVKSCIFLATSAMILTVNRFLKINQTIIKLFS